MRTTSPDGQLQHLATAWNFQKRPLRSERHICFQLDALVEMAFIIKMPYLKHERFYSPSLRRLSNNSNNT